MSVKKTLQSAKKWFDLAAAVLALAAIFMMFLPAVSIKGIDGTFQGIHVIFGYFKTPKDLLGNVYQVNYFGFSFMNLLTYILLIAAVVVLVLNMLGKGGKFANLIALALLIVVAVFAFCTIPFAVAGQNEVLGSMVSMWKMEDLTLLGGPIVTGILAILAAVINGAKILIK